MVRHFRVVALPVLAGCLALAGCGDTKPVAASGAPGAAVTASPAVPAAPVVSIPPPRSGRAKASAAPSVAPEVVVPSTTDVRVQQSYVGWQGLVLDGLRKVDARLVTTQAETLRKVRTTCRQMSTGMFETKVVPIIMTRFSSRELTVSHDMAEDIYSVILQEACYKMAETQNTSP